MKGATIEVNNRPLDLRTRRGSNGGEEEKENRLVDEQQLEHEDIVCAPSIPLILSTSSTSSTPLPSPLSPESQSSLSRPDKLCSPSPKSVMRTRKPVNGVLPKSTVVIDTTTTADDKCKNENSATHNSSSAVGGFNLTEMLMAAKELQFTPEMMPHFTAIQQISSAVKRSAVNPTANAPPLGLLPHVPLGSSVVPDLVDPTILNLLNSELARRLAVGNVSPNMSQYLRQGWYKPK